MLTNSKKISLKILRIYLTERERQPAREGTQAWGVGEEEAGSQRKSLTWGLVARTLGSRPEPKADT